MDRRTKQFDRPTNPHAPIRSDEEEGRENSYPDYEQSYMFEETEEDNKTKVRG